MTFDSQTMAMALGDTLLDNPEKEYTSAELLTDAGFDPAPFRGLIPRKVYRRIMADMDDTIWTLPPRIKRDGFRIRLTVNPDKIIPALFHMNRIASGVLKRVDKLVTRILATPEVQTWEQTNPALYSMIETMVHDSTRRLEDCDRAEKNLHRVMALRA